VRVVAVGGATLGGGGKTPLAIACARSLALSIGARVALVGHAYGARPGRARAVVPGDAADEVGDEAVVSARALAGAGVEVIVAPTRAEAVAFAARRASVLVLDGVLQTAPVRATLALLAVDAAAPWGAGHVPPRGDLRAPVPALLGAADAVVAIADEVDDGSEAGGWAGYRAVTSSRGARPGGSAGPLVGWDELARLRLGLACALARPARLLGFLRRRGVVPAALARAPDHGRVRPAALQDDVDAWLATEKCALHVPDLGRRTGRTRPPVATIDYDVVISPQLAARLAAAVAP
jgi:tetraacyldisaccharide 4'-kinase